VKRLLLLLFAPALLILAALVATWLLWAGPGPTSAPVTIIVDQGSSVARVAAQLDQAGAIRGNDVAKLTRIPGIGRKTAERMVLELRDKLPKEAFGEPAALPAITPVEEDVLSALMNLGYQRADAERALTSVSRNGKAASFEVMFRESLATLSK